MSLLDKGRELVTVYPEVEGTDRDGNVLTQPSDTGFTTRATIQPINSRGDSETGSGGYLSEEEYRMRLPRSFPFILGAQSAIDWEGEYWALSGDAQVYNGSANTAHVDYVIRRS